MMSGKASKAMRREMASSVKRVHANAMHAHAAATLSHSGRTYAQYRNGA
jgi:hypothetical protein